MINWNNLSSLAAGLYKIEGKIVSPEPKPSDWHWNTRILVDGGWKSAFIRYAHCEIGLRVIVNMASWTIKAMGLSIPDFPTERMTTLSPCSTLHPAPT